MTLSRRSFLGAAAGALLVPALGRHGERTTHGAPFRARPIPTPAQLAWQQDELALFVHFGINTFTDREWGDGTEDPALFDPVRLDARQWARAARAAGFRALVLTAKHHDGFCLWPTRTTSHSVRSSPWRAGGGDVVREFVDACRAEGLKAGLYCSPWDRNAPSYGDSPRYNDLYVEQLTELLTRYGAIHEVWFDGANGEGPTGRRQAYDWARFWDVVRRRQPGAVIFSDAGPDVRWIGNEAGSAGDPNWSTVDPAVVAFPGATGPGVVEHLQHGDPEGSVWRPGETDVSIRPGWFHHPSEDTLVRSADDLVDLYFTSVGRNSKLLLNVPPTAAGLLHDADVASLRGMRLALDALFTEPVPVSARVRTPAGPGAETAELDLGRPARVGIVDLREDIPAGQSVTRYRVEGYDGGAWRTLSEGHTIGYRKLDRLVPASVRAVRVTTEDGWGPPRPVEIGSTRADLRRSAQDSGSWRFQRGVPDLCRASLERRAQSDHEVERVCGVNQRDHRPFVPGRLARGRQVPPHQLRAVRDAAPVPSCVARLLQARAEGLEPAGGVLVRVAQQADAEHAEPEPGLEGLEPVHAVLHRCGVARLPGLAHRPGERARLRHDLGGRLVPPLLADDPHRPREDPLERGHVPVGAGGARLRRQVGKDSGERCVFLQTGVLRGVHRAALAACGDQEGEGREPEEGAATHIGNGRGVGPAPSGSVPPG